MNKDPHVVIIGGGFGGLHAARALAGVPVRVTLIDKRNYHLFRPLLYQVATGLLSADEIAAPLRSIFSRQRNIEVLMSEVNHIDTQNSLIKLPEYNLHYDFLILATGITYNYNGSRSPLGLSPLMMPTESAGKSCCRLSWPSELLQVGLPIRKKFNSCLLRSGRRRHSGCGNGKRHG